MKNLQELTSDQAFNRRIIDIAIKLSAMAIIILWCFSIIKDFVKAGKLVNRMCHCSQHYIVLNKSAHSSK